MPIMLRFATRAAFGHKEGSRSNYLSGGQAAKKRRFVMRQSTAAVIMVALGATAPLITHLAARAEEPVLRIAKQGSMEAGGRMINCATNDGGDPKSTRWPAGHVMVDNVYATFQYPAEMRHPH